jgi:acyl carrier protein
MPAMREDILEVIKTHLPFASDPSCVVRGDSALEDLGVTSLHLITMLLSLQEHFGLNVDLIGESGVPGSIDELVTLVESSLKQ